MAEALEPAHRSLRPQLDHRVEHRRRRHRILGPPGEAERPPPVADRPVPAVGVAHPLIEVVDQPVTEGATAVVADQRPLVGGLGRRQRVGGREHLAELAAKERLGGEPREDAAEAAAQQPLAERQARPVEDDAAVEQQGAAQIEPEPALEVAGEQLGRHRGAHVMRDDERRPVGGRGERLDQVRLPEEAVEVVAGLVGQAEAEEVGRQHRVAEAPVEHRSPVERARGKAVEQEQQRPVTVGGERRGSSDRETARSARGPPRRAPRR